MGGDLHVPIRSIVFETNIIPRLELLNEGVFEQQRLFFAVRNNDLDIGQLGEQKADLGATIPTPSILSDPCAQILRFTDIDNGSALILEFIDAGAGW